MIANDVFQEFLGLDAGEVQPEAPSIRQSLLSR